ncbi:hypothetical protein [Nonomuraea roseoviolacea]|uniref:Uncharacterized protein n=1 Tax=Nonomuraea roseoviolacea subsp. carminata TaxID=160689 RepID=A0ABT1KFQ0_9ACTN|nr:hypothetical protein [Nonomuraea roseoviolacea]MCP2352811.1 hypothetical protein [Nonomuraea roseoviolacea subsp. carminata]
MGDGQGFGYARPGFGAVAGMLEEWAAGLGSLAYGGDRVSLPTLALGAAAEWPARHEYGRIWDDLREEFLRGQREGTRLAERMRRTLDGYDHAEDINTTMSAALGRVLEAVRKAQETPSTLPLAPETKDKYDPYDLEDEPFPWKTVGGPSLAMGGGAMRGYAWFANDALDRDVGAGRAFIQELSDDVASFDRGYAKEFRENRLSRLARTTDRTRLNITTAKTFSWTAVAAGLAWSAVVVPSDEDVDRAIAGWIEIADRCGALFGHDTGPVREAIAAAWAGPAMEAADARIVEFVAAGVHVAERTRRLAQALMQTVRDLDRIFMAALVFSGVSAAAIVGLGIAARFNPALRPAVELLGSRLGTVAVLSAGLAPAVAAFAVAWYRVADANAPTRIGDREVTGFRQS